MTWKKTITVAACLLAVILLVVFWWISSLDFNRLKPMITRQVGSAIAREIRIEGDIRMKIGLAPTLITGPVKLRNADWGSRPDMLAVDAVELQIGLLALLSKKIVFKRLVLVKPEVWVEQNADGRRNNWQFGETPSEQPPSSARTAPKPYEVHLETVKIQDGGLTLHDRQTGATDRIKINTLSLDRQKSTLPLKIALEGGYNKTAITLEGEIGLLNDLLAAATDWAFDLTFKAKQTEITLAGRLQQPSGDQPPRLEATVKGPQLDLRPLLATPEDGPAPARKNAGRVFSKAPLPFGVLHHLDIEADIAIETLLLPHIALNKFAIPLRADSGRLVAGPAEAIAGGGDYQARFEIDARAQPPRMTADLQINQMNAGLMLEKLGLGNVMEGVVDFDAKLAGRGTSMAQLMGGLSGHAMLVSGEGRLGQGFFSLFSQDLTRQLRMLINPGEGRASHTPIECLVMRFDSSEGNADLSQLVWVTPDAVVVGGGGIDLRTETIDIGIQPTPKRGTINLGVLTKPFRLGGTLSNPRMAIEPTPTALTAGRIAGGLLIGPAGIALAFTRIGKDVANPCLAAVEAAEAGVAPEEKGFFEKIGDAVKSLGGD